MLFRIVEANTALSIVILITYPKQDRLVAWDYSIGKGEVI